MTERLLSNPGYPRAHERTRRPIKALKVITAATVLTGILAGTAFASSIGGATVNATTLNFRSAANTGSQILATAPQGSAVVVAQIQSDNWYKVVYKGTVGYMSGDYLTYSEEITGSFGTGNIYGDYVRMRTGPSLTSSIIGTYPRGTKMTVTGVSGAWYKVSYNGTVGYVHSDYFALNGGVSELYDNPSSASSISAGEVIVETAKKYLGVPYVYGGSSPSGFDCSGFVNYVYKECGYSINRTAASIYQNGVAVDRSNLQPGDVICFTNSSSSDIGHVGIYIGDGQFIHASSSGSDVRIDSLSTSYYTNHYYGARRIV